ncbi:hypothetical protein [Streptomyces sp. NPDC005281]|uniref:hypothetical protein n=1 Tax=Streptomyces sp. NPDC005281 TaxID=3155712 RepID=UPI0033A63A39
MLLTELQVCVAHAAGIVPYFRKVQRTALFQRQLEAREKIGHSWRANASHGPALRLFPEFGGLAVVPTDVKVQIVRRMTLCYIGEPGGHGTRGRGRHGFYSNSAAPVIEQMFKEDREIIRDDVSGLRKDRSAGAVFRVGLRCCEGEEDAASPSQRDHSGRTPCSGSLIGDFWVMLQSEPTTNSHKPFRLKTVNGSVCLVRR